MCVHANIIYVSDIIQTITQTFILHMELRV